MNFITSVGSLFSSLSKSGLSASQIKSTISDLVGSSASAQAGPMLQQLVGLPLTETSARQQIVNNILAIQGFPGALADAVNSLVTPASEVAELQTVAAIEQQLAANGFMPVVIALILAGGAVVDILACHGQIGVTLSKLLPW